jgi:hypothetical protein
LKKLKPGNSVVLVLETMLILAGAVLLDVTFPSLARVESEGIKVWLDALSLEELRFVPALEAFTVNE